MTSLEVKRKIDSNEERVKSAHISLCHEARTLGDTALVAAKQKTTKKALIPLIIFLIFGVIVGLIDRKWCEFCVLAGVGIFIAIKMRNAEKNVENDVERARETLMRTIQNNEEI